MVKLASIGMEPGPQTTQFLAQFTQNGILISTANSQLALIKRTALIAT